MTSTKEKEKERLSAKAFAEMREWLTSMPLSNKNVEKNLYYIFDFITVASHLGLPQNSRILELGAGSCWPSEWLYRMGYRTVSSDISHDMLRLGKERFMPLRQAKDNYILHADFICSDAEFLPFADESFDAVIVFNAFHHFPDFLRTFKEIYRILTPSGKLVFSEPGEGHSESDEAKREMAEHGVLEKDILIDEVDQLAGEAGFALNEVIFNKFPDRSIACQDWYWMSKPRNSLAYRLGVFVDLFRKNRRHPEAIYHAELVSWQRQHPCMVFKKQIQAIKDSRLPGELKADLKQVQVDKTLQAGHPFRLVVNAKNQGDTRWICQGDFLASGAMNLGEGGYVSLGVKLFAENGALVDDNFGRGALPCSVDPGNEANVTALLSAPDTPGTFRLKLDLVDEGITWFEDRGSVPMDAWITVIEQTDPPVFDSRFPDVLTAGITVEPDNLKANPENLCECLVTVVNHGNTIWRQAAPQDDPPAFGGGFVRIGIQLYDADRQLLDLNFARYALPHDILPQQSATIPVSFTPPEQSGRYYLKFDLVVEQIAWFSDRGSEPVKIKLVVGQ